MPVCPNLCASDSIDHAETFGLVLTHQRVLQALQGCLSSKQAQVRKLLLDLASAAAAGAHNSAQQHAGLAVLLSGELQLIIYSI
jgi:hypothetical protein